MKKQTENLLSPKSSLGLFLWPHWTSVIYLLHCSMKNVLFTQKFFFLIFINSSFNIKKGYHWKKKFWSREVTQICTQCKKETTIFNVVKEKPYTKKDQVKRQQIFCLFLNDHKINQYHMSIFGWLKRNLVWYWE